ncbi:27915_t:CDS:2, partial [Gigaspora margarita]
KGNKRDPNKTKSREGVINFINVVKKHDSSKVPFPVEQVDLQLYINHHVNKRNKDNSLKQYLAHIRAHNIAIGANWDYHNFEPIIEEGLRKLSVVQDEARDDANTIQQNTIEENSFTGVSSQSESLTDTNEQSFINNDLALSYIQTFLEPEVQTSPEYNLQQASSQAFMDLVHINEDSLQFEGLFEDSGLELGGSIYAFRNFNNSLQGSQGSEIQTRIQEIEESVIQ